MYNNKILAIINCIIHSIVEPKNYSHYIIRLYYETIKYFIREQILNRKQSSLVRKLA